MKSHVKLFTTVLREAGQDCGVSTRQDEVHVLARLAKEGDSFLTISLPAYEKDLLRALDQGSVTSDLFTGFRRRGGLPMLFSGFLRIIFDNQGLIRPTSGELVRAVRRLRQILLLLSKIELECSPSREEAALAQYVETDREVPSELDATFVQEFRHSFRLLFGDFLNGVEKDLFWNPFLRGYHGPGAVADHTPNNQRWGLTQWTDRLEAVFPAQSTLACNLHDYLDQDFSWYPVFGEPPVRVVTVPKTMKGPRVIAVEPAHMQYVQQGLFRIMTQHLLAPENTFLNSRMGWTDQEPNRDLAKDFVNYATIDLSEASDRVPFSLVRDVFEDFPVLRAGICASRSESAELPSGEVILLKKFASMGSALCFPIESMIFAACIFHAMLIDMTTGEYKRHSRGPISWTLGRLPMFRVFGDDMVVPRALTPTLLQVLEAIGLKVNYNKSFWTGKFRESCGADWYDGHDVSVVKVRTLFPVRRADTSGIIRGISLHNRLMEAGMFGSAQCVEEQLLRAAPMFYAPIGSDTLALWTYDDAKVDWKINRRTHEFQHRAYKPSYRYKLDELDSWGALRKYFGRAEEWDSPWEDLYDRHTKRVYPATDPEHLRYSGRPLRVTINAGYVSPTRTQRG